LPSKKRYRNQPGRSLLLTIALIERDAVLLQTLSTNAAAQPPLPKSTAFVSSNCWLGSREKIEWWHR
jgi:hypothetical protein